MGFRKPNGWEYTVVYPGYFKTNFLGKGSLLTPRAPIEAYKAARQSQSFHEQEMNGRQQGDPQKAAQVLMRMSALQQPPLHLFLGGDAYEIANTKIEEVKADLERWKEESLSTALSGLQR